MTNFTYSRNDFSGISQNPTEEFKDTTSNINDDYKNTTSILNSDTAPSDHSLKYSLTQK